VRGARCNLRACVAGSSNEPVSSTPVLREKLVKKRLALIWAPIVVCLALMLPSSTMAATGYTFKIVDQHCLSGGHNIYFRVSLTAAGSTPANKLTIKSTSQYLSGGTWHNFYKWTTDKTTFTPNGQPHVIDYSYTHTDNSDPNKWRIKSVLKAWQGTHVLAHKTLTSKAC
jgi:hypothetical protein